MLEQEFLARARAFPCYGRRDACKEPLKETLLLTEGGGDKGQEGGDDQERRKGVHGWLRFLLVGRCQRK